MSRPYSKPQFHRGGRRHNDGNEYVRRWPSGHESGRRGGYRGRGGGGGAVGRGDGGAGGKAPQSTLMTTLLDLLFQKSSNTIFDPQSGMLNLSNFRQSEDLSAVQESVDFNNVTFCKSLVNVIKNNIGSSLRILSINCNQIQKLSVFLTQLEEADVHRGITAISATDNQINDFAFLGPLKRYGCLGELLLEGNPVAKREDYASQIVRKLQILMMLDGQVINRMPLRLPNPVPVNLNDMQCSVLFFIESNIFAMAAAGKYNSLVDAYNSNAIFSVSRSDEPIPARFPCDARHNSATLTLAQRNTITSDFSFLRRQIPWRNLQTDVQSLRSISQGKVKVSTTLNVIGGGEKKFFSITHELNSNANVVFLSDNMAKPTCIVTVHGRLLWHWSPKSGSGDLFPREEAPFMSCFFDRTMTLLLDPAGTSWLVHNDMMFLRPDMTVQLADGTRGSPIFMANEPQRIDKMRRRYLPHATPEVMRALIESVGSDADVLNFIESRLSAIPADRMEALLRDSDAMKACIKGG